MDREHCKFMTRVVQTTTLIFHPRSFGLSVSMERQGEECQKHDQANKL